MDIKRIPVTQIKAAAYNPRKALKPGDPEYEKLARSMAEFGFVEPLVWNRRTGNLVGGHQRLTVLKAQGVKVVECSVVDLDDRAEKALNIALNKVGGEWDMTQLKDLLEELGNSAYDVTLTGFDEEELEQLMAAPGGEEPEIQEDDFDAEAVAESITQPNTRRGEVWLLGRHRLICGDSTDLGDVR